MVQNTSAKSPDVRIKLAHRWVTIEFKALHATDEETAWDPFHQEVLDLKCARDLQSVSFDVELTEAARTNPRAVVDGLEAVASGDHKDFQPLPEATGRARLSEGNCGRWVYPFTQQSDLARIASKLHGKWWEQLASAPGPTLLIVRAEHLFDVSSVSAFLATAQRIANTVRPILEGKAMVGGVLVYEEPFWAPFPRNFQNEGTFRVSTGVSLSGTARFAVLVPAPAARVPLQPDELDCFISRLPVW